VFGDIKCFFKDISNMTEENSEMMRDICQNQRKRKQEMNSKPLFKIGPAKLKNGDSAVIFEINKDQIFGKYHSAFGWKQITWTETGHYYGRYDGCECDLLPNNVAEKITFEDEIGFATKYMEGSASIANHQLLTPFIGKKVRVTVECLEE
jgi:hypothetical protein